MISLSSRPCFVKRSLPVPREHRGGALPSPHVKTHHHPPLHRRSFCLFFLGSVLFLHRDPSWFWPLGDATRFPLPQRILCDSPTQALVLTPVAPAPLSAILPPPATSTAAGLGLGEEASPPPGSATCAGAAAAACGPALLQVRPGAHVRSRSPRAGHPCGSLPRDPRCLRLRIRPSPCWSCPSSLPCTIYSPISPLSSETGIPRLLTPLGQPLQGNLFWTQALPLPRSFLARKISRGLSFAASSLEPALSHAILTSNGRRNNRHPNSSLYP